MQRNVHGMKFFKSKYICLFHFLTFNSALLQSSLNKWRERERECVFVYMRIDVQGFAFKSCPKSKGATLPKLSMKTDSIKSVGNYKKFIMAIIIGCIWGTLSDLSRPHFRFRFGMVREPFQKRP